MEPDRVDRDEVCLVAAAPSVTPWSVRRERAALREGGVDAVFATVSEAAMGVATRHRMARQVPWHIAGPAGEGFLHR